MPRHIYLATSWRNVYYEYVRKQLIGGGHAVYDFRHEGFSWSKVDIQSNRKDFDAYKRAIAKPIAIEAFNRDMKAMQEADTCILLTPSGRSAHLEFGWMIGQGKEGFVLIAEPQEWDLMYKMTPDIKITNNFSELERML